MKKLAFIFLIALYSLSKSFSQNPRSLDKVEIDKLFPNNLVKTFSINFPIYKVYNYSDITGNYYCILSESRDEINTLRDTINFKIKAVTLKSENESFSKAWEINDQIIDKEVETSIWFWTKYIDFKDYNNDGVIESIIVYGTNGLNGYGDGRIKFIIYNKGNKVAIRHQNSEMDFYRSIQIDQTFYSLPIQLQNSIKQKMKLMEQNNNAIFPSKLESGMKNKKLLIKD
jgi:hypothetical protein